MTEVLTIISVKIIILTEILPSAKLQIPSSM